MKARIILATDIRSVRGEELGHCGYILQAVKAGEVIAERSSWDACSADRYGALLIALRNATDRLTASADEVEVVTDSQPVECGIRFMDRWKESGWKRSKGRPVARKEVWEDIAKTMEGKKMQATRQSVENTLRYLNHGGQYV